MPEVRPCEILVVGAGPAGSRAAWVAAGAGVDTILIDAKTRIGEQPHCGEFVSERLFTEAQLDGAAILHRVEFMETRIVESADPSIWEAAAPGVHNVVSSRGFLIDRVRFDRDRAREAAAVGATILSSTRLVQRDGERWIARRGSEELILRPKFTIAADGAASTVGRLLELPAHTLMRGIQIEAPFTVQGERTYIFFHRALKGGYGWVFPKGPVANVGIGVTSDPEIKPPELLEHFIAGVARMGLSVPDNSAGGAARFPSRVCGKTWLSAMPFSVAMQPVSPIL